MDPVSIFLSIVKGAASHWKAMVVAVMIGAIAILCVWNAQLRHNVESWKAVAAAKQQAAEAAVATAWRAEIGRRSLRDEIAKYMERARENERKLEETRFKISSIMRDAKVAAEREREAATERIKDLETRLEGMSECEKCIEVLIWLNEEF